MSEATEDTALAEARAKLAALRKARADRDAAATKETPEALAEAIAEEEREAADAAAIADATSKHGKVGVAIGYVKTRLGVIIVKRAHISAFQRFQDLAEPKMRDIEQLVRPCVVHPSPEEFDRIMTELPGALGLCGKVIGNLAGAASKETSGKF